MNVTNAPFDNVDVRRAIKWSIDRDELVNKIVRGYGMAGNDDPSVRTRSSSLTAAGLSTIPTRRNPT